MGISFLKKITTAGIGLNVTVLEAVVKGKGDTYTPVARVYGSITGSEAGKDTGLGPYTVFHGEFEAENMTDGQKYRATRMILPGIAETPLLSIVDGEGSRVKFALELTVNENRSKLGGVKYRFGVTPLMDMNAEDELSQMAANLPKSLEDKSGKKAKR